MTLVHPLDVLQGYRLGSRQVTTELQRSDVPNIHIQFKVLQLVADVQQGHHRAILLTGTAGDGKTYLAYRIIEVLQLNLDTVLAAQRYGGYNQHGIFIDLDLSAGSLSPDRVARLHHVLSTPQQLVLICANEGKLAELEDRFVGIGLGIPESVLRINLSRRAIVHPNAWSNVLHGVLTSPFWDGSHRVSPTSPLAHNKTWLNTSGFAERLRRYLLLPYLLGEPITVRETLSFLAYALGGGQSSEQELTEPIRYLLYNTLFSEPEGYEHGGRATPNEKLLWWLYRFDPADQASPEVDLRLLVHLDNPQALGVPAPDELLRMWQTELVVYENELNDTLYRRRLARFMRYARRWYALASEEGFNAYFPFRHFRTYLELLAAPEKDLQTHISPLIQGLNHLLSGGQIDDDFELKVFYVITDGSRQTAVIYSSTEAIDESDLELCSDLQLHDDENVDGDAYLERLPRRLYLQYRQSPDIRLPISLLLYEVLLSTVSPTAGFPATLWARERDTVTRFMGALNRIVRPSGGTTRFSIQLPNGKALELRHRLSNNQFTAS